MRRLRARNMKTMEREGPSLPQRRVDSDHPKNTENWRRSSAVLCCSALLLCCIVVIGTKFVGFDRSLHLELHVPSAAHHRPEKKIRTNKTILYFTSYFGRVPDWGEGSEPFQDCPVSECLLTANPNNLQSMSEFDAFFYHGITDKPIQEPNQVWTWRKPHQTFILMGQESPANHPVTPLRERGQTKSLSTTTDPYDSFFNWTMGYRTDSDIWFPYGWFYELPTQQTDEPPADLSASIPSKWKNYNEADFYRRLQQKDASSQLLRLAQRPKKVAWMVTNCASLSHREAYAKELSKHIQVDIFGACGSIKCDLSYDQANRESPNTISQCDAKIRSDYKFYLSFENSLCDDYVTEKFFTRVNDHVVVTLNQAQGYAPPHSHISVFDFASPKALADYLHYLDANTTAYLSYFWWQDYYRVVTPRPSKQANDRWGVKGYWSSMCAVCSSLHKLDETSSPDEQQHPTLTKVYDHLLEWYAGGAAHPRCGRKLPQIVGQLKQ